MHKNISHTTSFVTFHAGFGATMFLKTTQTQVNYSLLSTIILLNIINSTLERVNDIKFRATWTSFILTTILAVSIVHVIIAAVVAMAVLIVAVAVVFISTINFILSLALTLTVQTNTGSDLGVSILNLLVVVPYPTFCNAIDLACLHADICKICFCFLNEGTMPCRHNIAVFPFAEMELRGGWHLVIITLWCTPCHSVPNCFFFCCLTYWRLFDG